MAFGAVWLSEPLIDSMKTLPASDRLRRVFVGGCAAVFLLSGVAVGCAADATSAPSASPTVPVAEPAKPAAPAGADALLEKCVGILTYGDLNRLTKPGKADAVVALGVLGDERAVPVLVEHLRHSDNDSLRLQIVKALGWIGGAQAVPALEEALKDKYPFVRKQAATALRALTGREYDYDRTGLPDMSKVREALRGATAPANPE